MKYLVMCEGRRQVIEADDVDLEELAGCSFFRFTVNDGPLIEGANFRNRDDRETFIEFWREQSLECNRDKVRVVPPGMTITETKRTVAFFPTANTQISPVPTEVEGEA